MTVVYELAPAEDAPVLALEPADIYARLIAREVGPDETVVGNLVLHEGRKQLRPANFPMTGAGFLVADEEARRIVERPLSGCGHWVNVSSHDSDKRYSGFVCTRQLPALAEESDVSRLASGAILNIRRLELREEVVRGVGAFVLSEWPRGPVYFSSGVVDAIAEANLTGLVSLVAWSNEADHPARVRRLVNW